MDGNVLGSLETGPVREGDLADVVTVLEAADRALGLPSEPIREELIWLWHLPTTDLERDTRILRDGDAVIAYGEAIWKHPDEGGPLDLSVRVHPDYRGAGIGSCLLTWGERLASERGSDGVRAYAADRDASAQDLLREILSFAPAPSDYREHAEQAVLLVLEERLEARRLQSGGRRRLSSLRPPS